MKTTVRDLVQVQTIQEIVNLENYDPQYIVSTFVFTDRLENEMDALLRRLLQRAEKNSFMVIGNYGSGKSHFLAYTASLLKQPERWKEIQSSRIRKTGEQLAQKPFVLVEYRLPAVMKPLPDIFWDRVQRAMREWGINIAFSPDEYDHRDRMDKVLQALYNQLGEGIGLVVVFDELADFLHAKFTEDQTGPLHLDLGFLRDLGEISSEFNFSFIAALQEDLINPEHPEMKRHADNINRILQRFEKLRLLSENLKKIAAERILTKNNEQQNTLRNLYATTKKRFPDIRFGEEEFVALYPAHPTVFEVYDRLVQYLGNRSVLKFVSDECLKIADESPDTFVTIDRILEAHREDLWWHPEAQAYIKAHDNIVQDALPLLEASERESAKRALSALAVLSLIDRRFTVVDLANALLFGEFTNGLNYDALDYVLRELARRSGQYFSVTGEGRERVYLLVAKEGPDVEALIQTRLALVQDDDPALWDMVLSEHLGKRLNMRLQPDQRVEDGFWWSTGNTRRSGKVGYYTKPVTWSEVEATLVPGVDFGLVIESPSLGNKGLRRTDVKDERISIWKPASLDPESLSVLKRDLAIRRLLREKEGEPELKEVLVGKLATNEEPSRRIVEKLYYDGGEIGGSQKKEVQLPLLKEDFEALKHAIFNDALTSTYKEHPKFGARLVGKQQTNRLIKDFIFPKEAGTSGTLGEYIKQFGEPLDLATRTDNRYFLNPHSKYLDMLEQQVKHPGTPVVSMQGLKTSLAQAPYGFPEIVIELLLAALLRLGKIVLVTKKGERYPVGKWDEALEIGLTNFEAVAISGIVSDPPKLRQLFLAVACEIGIINTIDDQNDAWDKALNFKKSLGLETLGQELSQLPFDFQEVLNEASEAQTAMAPLLDELWEGQDPRDAFEAVLIANLAVDILKQAWHHLKTVIELAQDAPKLALASNYLKGCAEIELSITQRRDQLLAELAPDLSAKRARDTFLRKFEAFRGDYIESYTSIHEGKVGALAAFDKVTALQDDPRMQSLQTLQDLRIKAGTPVAQIGERIGELLSYRCLRLNKEELRARPLCSCGFSDPTIVDAVGILEQLEQTVEDSLKAYCQAILAEEETLRRNLSNMDEATRRQQVLTLLDTQSLPMPVDDDLVSALNFLLEDIVMVEIRLADLVQSLGSGGHLTWREFKEALDKLIEAKRPTGVEEKRIRVVVR